MKPLPIKVQAPDFFNPMWLIVAVLLFGLVSCSLPAAGGDPGPLGDATIAAAATLIAAAPNSGNDPIPPSPQVSTPETLLPGPSTGTPQPTPLGVPGEPPPGGQTLTDRSSAALADEARSLGDYFDMNFYERPFTSDEMVYAGYLDLVSKAYLVVSPPWIYVTLSVEEAPPTGAQAVYAVELDQDRDGRGDWLIVADAPPSETWTTEGVKVYFDSNEDVGGRIPIQADTVAGDGYDSLVFDQGQGMGTAAAWVRRGADGAASIQFAFRTTLLGDAATFIWGVWAAESLPPDQFDFNDHFTHEQAGSPLINSRFYPLKKLAMIDNSCRWVYGYVPGSPAAGLCFFNTPTPTITPVPTATTEL